MAKASKQKRNPNLMTSSANIRFESPATRDRTPKQNPLTVIAPDELVGGFIDFLRNHAIVGLAIGFVIATQVQAVVKQLVSSFIEPTFQLFFKGALLNDSITWHFNGRTVSYNWGVFANDLLDFIFVLAALYLIIRIFKLDRLDKPKTTK